MDENINKRLSKRIYRHFIARFRILPDGPLKENSSNWEVVTLNDLSAGGAQFNYNKEIKPGSILEMLVTFLWLKQPLGFRAEVLRVQKAPDCPSLYRIAIIFVDLDENNIKIINSFAGNLSPRRK